LPLLEIRRRKGGERTSLLDIQKEREKRKRTRSVFHLFRNIIGGRGREEGAAFSFLGMETKKIGWQVRCISIIGRGERKKGRREEKGSFSTSPISHTRKS